MRQTVLLLAAFLAVSGPAALAQENLASDLPKIAPRAQGDLEPTARALQGELTELQNLALQAKQAHWNVSGTLFYPLHELLQKHYEGYTEYADRVAERLSASASPPTSGPRQSSRPRRCPSSRAA